MIKTIAFIKLFSACIIIAACASQSEQNESGAETDQKSALATERVIPGKANANGENTIIFQRKKEPRENAFSLLVPKGWIIEGGIFRVDPTMQGGAAQSIAAKCDFAVKNDRKGSAMIRWLPDVLYFDMRGAPAASMFPPGSNYNGMTVMYKMYPQDFIQQVVIPYAHPQATNVVIKEVKNLPKLASRYQGYVKAIAPYLTMAYYASLVTITYNDGGTQYLEKIVCVIEDYGSLGAGLWGNKETFLVRTPVNEYEHWAPIFSVMQNSVEFNTQWLVGEIRGQMKRSEIMQQTLIQIQDLDRQIVEHQQKTNAEIHNDMFLTLTDQEEYVNPYTNKVEIGSNQWKHRWTNDIGDIIYTDVDDYNPNHDVNLNAGNFKQTPVRKRFPQ